VASVLFVFDSFKNPSSANDQNSSIAFSLPPLSARGEVEGGFSKATFVKNKPSEKPDLE
jgi:hypothetical protein